MFKFSKTQDQIDENFEDEGSFTDFPEFLTLVSKVKYKIAELAQV